MMIQPSRCLLKLSEAQQILSEYFPWTKTSRQRRKECESGNPAQDQLSMMRADAGVQLKMPRNSLKNYIGSMLDYTVNYFGPYFPVHSLHCTLNKFKLTPVPLATFTLMYLRNACGRLNRSCVLAVEIFSLFLPFGKFWAGIV